MGNDLFAFGGPEGRNSDSRDFEDRLSLLAVELGYKVIEVNVDTLVGDSAKSQGIDGIWAYHNPRTGRGEGWLTEAKRHDGQHRYTPKLLADEVQTLRDKVGRLGNQQQRFFGDPDIARHIQDLRGGLLFHRTPGYCPDRASDRLAGIVPARNETGTTPTRVLFVGPDMLNALAETFDRFGKPAKFWWPATGRTDGIWARCCPPEQVSAGLVLYQTVDRKRVLLVRDKLTRHDPQAISDLAWRCGESFDTVAFTHATIEQRRVAAKTWERVARAAKERPDGRLPDRVEVLSLGHDSTAPFERRWDPEGAGGLPSAESPSDRHTRRHARLEGMPPILSGRKRNATAYPSPLDVGLTFAAKANLHGASRFFRSEGIVLFADEKAGVSSAAKEIWLRPSAYRHMGHMLDLAPAPTISGFTLTQLAGPQAALPIREGSLLDGFAQAARQLKDEPVNNERFIRLRALTATSSAWQLRLDLTYDHVFDLVGGSRLIDEAEVTIMARSKTPDCLDIAIISTREGDFAAAAEWLRHLRARVQESWVVAPVALPRTDPDRSDHLKTITASMGPRLLGLSSPNQHREPGTSSPASGFGRALRSAAYDTEFTDLDSIVARGQDDRVLLAELTSYLQVDRSPSTAMAMRLRQRKADAHLSIRWQTGRTREASDQALNRSTWEELRSVDWTFDKKQSVLLDEWGRILDALAGAQASAAELRDTA